MSQTEIARLLSDAYPEYLTTYEIMRRLDISKQSVMRSLHSMKQRDEIEFKMISRTTRHTCWTTMYRIRRDEQ